MSPLYRRGGHKVLKYCGWVDKLLHILLIYGTMVEMKLINVGFTFKNSVQEFLLFCGFPSAHDKFREKVFVYLNMFSPLLVC